MSVLGLQVVNAGGRYVHPATFTVLVQLTDLSPEYVTDSPFGPAAPVGYPATVTITIYTPSGQTYLGNLLTADPNSATNGLFSITRTTAATDEQGEYTASFVATNGTDVGTFPRRPFAIFGGI